MPTGAPLEGFSLAHPEAGIYPNPSPLAGQMADDGSGALLGSAKAAGTVRQALLARDPGGAFKEVAGPLPEAEAPAGEAGLQSGEKLFGSNQAPMVAALEEGGGHAGALVVPVDEGGEQIESSVLHWDGENWSREQIEVPAASSEEFTVIALAASSPADAWLLARLSSNYPPGSVGLFRRQVGAKGEPVVWRAVTPAPGGEAGGPLQRADLRRTRPFHRRAGHAVAGPDGQRRRVVAGRGSRRQPGLGDDVPAPDGRSLCPGGLGMVRGRHPVLPRNAAGAAAALRRAQLRMAGRRARRTCRHRASLRSQPASRRRNVPRGACARRDSVSRRRRRLVRRRLRERARGLARSIPAACSSHDSTPAQPADELARPVPPHPAGARAAAGRRRRRVGKPGLAVGDRGEVARYAPGSGWLPESLGIGKSHPTPRLRAVAWPRPARVYAVGDEGAMWMWRGETGLWEADPGAPLNFQGNLLGIAFDPGNPSRGYAVGQSGVLLRYGKSWQQEPLPAEALCTPEPSPSAEEQERCSNWRYANFTSIAFAGSEALVAYRVLISTRRQQYRGGLLVNSGSGWHVDTAAAAALGTSTPYAVAALPDGGAAVGATTALGGAAVLERESAGAAWHPTPTPFPGQAPGSLAAFREGGALRVVAAGTVPATAALESEEPPPPGAPPIQFPPYPVEPSAEQGVLRQTATGWSDEEHELNNVKEPVGRYFEYDTVYQPDPVFAVMVDESGSHGWAVGGFADARRPELDTADVARYPNDGTSPPQAGASTIAVDPNALATFAIGGNAKCEAPCVPQQNARLGPDVWLTSALARAASIPGVQKFIYTGPRLTTGRTAGPTTLPVPYQEETERYAQLLAPFPNAVAVPSPTDTVGSGSEAAFRSQFAEPYGNTCSAPGCSYYAFDSGGVRVIVLDENGAVGAEQLGWLEGQLEQAASLHEPAIVVGSANLPALLSEHVGWAQNVARALGEGAASAYLFDAPEENVKLELPGGVPAFGSGTLGYVNFLKERSTDFHGASGFMLVGVGPYNSAGGGRSKVSARLIPNIGELAIEPVEGTILQRSQVVLFEGLARRVRAGNRAHNQASWANRPRNRPLHPDPRELLRCCMLDRAGARLRIRLLARRQR